MLKRAVLRTLAKRGVTMQKLKGSCLCGGVRYEADGPLLNVARCHCTQCRKASGAEFATNGSVSAAAFRVVAGAELLSEYEWSAGQARTFCSRCGSPLFKRKKALAGGDMVRLRLGCLDSENTQQPVCHVFVGEKPTWSSITDELPQFEAAPKV
jgi:hypothetical protein